MDFFKDDTPVTILSPKDALEVTRAWAEGLRKRGVKVREGRRKVVA